MRINNNRVFFKKDIWNILINNISFVTTKDNQIINAQNAFNNYYPFYASDNWLEYYLCYTNAQEFLSVGEVPPDYSKMDIDSWFNMLYKYTTVTEHNIGTLMDYE